MTEQQIKDAIHSFLKSWTTGDIKQALSLFTDDTVWETPNGTFKGMSQCEKYATWVFKGNTGFKIVETGVGIIVQGDAALIEHDLFGTINGAKWEAPANCIWEFKDGKVANVRTFVDVLTQAQQVANGVFAKFAVNAVVNASRKGL